MASTHSPAKSKPIDILIVGTGVAGLALASFLLLGQLEQDLDISFRITLLERAKSIQTVGQNIDIRGPGKDVLERLGVRDAVRSATTGEEGAKFVDTTGYAWASFGVDKTGKVETGTGEIEILRGRLAQILFQRCSELSEQIKRKEGHGVEFIFGDSLAELQQQAQMPTDIETKSEGDRVRVRFTKSGETRQFDIVVGADGLQSRTRALAWNSEYILATANKAAQSIDGQTNGAQVRRRTPNESETKDPIVAAIKGDSNESGADPYLKPLHVYAAFYSIPASLLEGKDYPTGSAESDDFDDGWRRWYHAPGRKSVMVRPSDDKTRLTVLMTVIDLENQDRRLPSAAIVKEDRNSAVANQKQLMQEYFQDAGWVCAKLVDGVLAADDFYYDIVAQVKMNSWWNEKVCLLGDAAYCASPFSGMGTTLALVGAYNLAGSLLKHVSASPQSKTSPSVKDLATAFTEYELTTSTIVSNAQKLPPGMPWLIHPETSWGIWVMHRIVGFIWWSGLDKAAARLAGGQKQKSSAISLVEWNTSRRQR